MKTKWRKWMIAGGIIVLLPIALKIIFFPPGPAIECHKNLDGCFRQWKQDNKSSAYPNVQGDRLKSLMVIAPYFPDTENSLRDYVYIPGLQTDDPVDLVLMYVRKKTRQTWHGDCPTIFRTPNWLVISADFDSPEIDVRSHHYPLNDGKNQLSSTDDLRRRIKLTLDYLKTNNRSNWQAIVAEQTRFLESVHD